MTVYVDDMKQGFRGMVMCHMVADTDEELHAVAEKIGLKRSWWQSPAKGGSHYDLSLSKRTAAIQNGAIEVSMRVLSAMNFRRKVTGELGSPEDAVAFLKLWAQGNHHGR